MIEEANWLTLPQDIEGSGAFDAVVCLGNSFAHLPDISGDQSEHRYVWYDRVVRKMDEACRVWTNVCCHFQKLHFIQLTYCVLVSIIIIFFCSTQYCNKNILYIRYSLLCMFSRLALSNFAEMVKPGGILLIDHRNYDYIIDKGSAPANNIYYNVSSVYL